MASILLDIPIAADAAAVWDAVRDVGEVHRRLAPGFVTDTRMEGDTRVVTFFNGRVARERIVSLDDDAMRLAYAISSERLKHHHATITVAADGAGRCRMAWTTDVLPAEVEPTFREMMQHGAEVMRRTMEGTGERVDVPRANP
jgi:Polyketide cyclase / dehydrase and lipid transport